MGTERLDAADPRVLDRLVDGELSEQQERQVLAQLEHVPDGWRRCALAFLEARLWGRELRVPERRAADATGPVRRRAATAPGAAGWSRLLAIAAIFLFAFTVGRFTPRPWDWAPQSDPAGSPSVPGEEVTAANPAPGTLPIDALRDNPLQPQRPLGNLTLVDEAGRQLELPVFFAREEAMDQLLFPQPLPEDVLGKLKRHEVRRVQRLVPVTLKSGLQVVVPVQEYDIVRKPAY